MDDVLRFLRHSIDDLYARDALLTAGCVRVDEFRAALPEAIRLDDAAEPVPPALVSAVDERLLSTCSLPPSR